MSMDWLLWQQACQRVLWGKRNPIFLLARQSWFALTELPLLLAARQELAQAIKEAEADYQQREKQLISHQAIASYKNKNI
jgi:hypothetical protein